MLKDITIMKEATDLLGKGGDWNMTPGSCTIEGLKNAAAYMDPIDSTCNTGNTLDWYMISGGLAIGAETSVDTDTQIYAHYPVKLKIGGELSQDLGEISKQKVEHWRKTGSDGTRKPNAILAIQRTKEEHNSREEDNT
eukprot:44196-Heterocapsa_arctica.AAC.1